MVSWVGGLQLMVALPSALVRVLVVILLSAMVQVEA
jgi:hypothetical protein